MDESGEHTRVLIYSQDSFGLGHLRRWRAIANGLVERNPNMSVLILSGSPIIGSFEFRRRVDFVRGRGVIKLRNGEYTSHSLKLGIEDTMAMRASIIRHTADVFDPDLFLVDKEPLGLRGEVGETLEMLKTRGTALVLGLRDVLDEPSLLAPEWERKNTLPALQDLYDEIWVYGLPQICDPLAELPLSDSIRRRAVFTGYLERSAARISTPSAPDLPFEAPFLLVTPGGGDDGEALVDWVLRAYEADRGAPHPALIVFGPFMASDSPSQFVQRAANLDNVEAITFDANVEIRRADAVIGLSSADTACVTPLLRTPGTLRRLAPFIDTGPFEAEADHGAAHHASLATRLGLEREAPVLLAVAMMRDGDKLASYRVLAAALARLTDEPWTLVVAGDGPARRDVEAEFAGGRVHFIGAVEAGGLPALYAAADIYVWPAVREAFGIAILEAQAAGLPVVAGDAGGVGDIVADGETGLLAAEGDAASFAEVLAVLLRAPYYTAAYSAAARRKAAASHGLDAASVRLDRILHQTVAAARR